MFIAGVSGPQGFGCVCSYGRGEWTTRQCMVMARVSRPQGSVCSWQG